LGAIEQEKKKDSLLWEVYNPETGMKSYLFGTIHVDASLYKNKLDRLMPYFTTCSTLVLEMDLAEQDIVHYQKAITLKESDWLDKRLSKRVYAKLEQLCGRYWAKDTLELNKTHPLILLNKLSLVQFESAGGPTLDLKLLQIAQENALLTGGLETFEEQLSVFARVPLKEQFMRLKQVATNFGAYRKDVLRMKDVYASENVYKMHKLARRSCGGLRKILLYDRNQLMFERMQPYLSKGDAFIAVGAGHFGGKKGILAALKRGGFTLKAL
jgi:uncharacterized protein